MKYWVFCLIFLSFSGFGSNPELTSDLNGVEITYTYGNGGSYQLKYTPEGVRYRFLSGEARDEWWGPFPYQAYRTQSGEYFLAWYEKGYGDHITQLVNLKAKTLYGSGLIVKKSGTIEHFQFAKIEKISRFQSATKTRKSE